MASDIFGQVSGWISRSGLIYSFAVSANDMRPASKVGLTSIPRSVSDYETPCRAGTIHRRCIPIAKGSGVDPIAASRTGSSYFENTSSLGCRGISFLFSYLVCASEGGTKVCRCSCPCVDIYNCDRYLDERWNASSRCRRFTSQDTSKPKYRMVV